MLILNQDDQPIILDSIYSPTLSSSFWVLDLELEDFTLTPLTVLEERIAPTLTLKALDGEFPLPASWMVMVYDEETMQLDVTPVSELTGKDFTLFGFGPKKNMVVPIKAQVVNYHPEAANVNPLLNKHQMLCHPISQETWINIAPSDVYSKYLKEKLVGDLI